MKKFMTYSTKLNTDHFPFLNLLFPATTASHSVISDNPMSSLILPFRYEETLTKFRQ